MRIPRLRMSVRWLMILVLLVGGGFGWVVKRARDQRLAVAVLRAAGQRVEYEPGWRHFEYAANGGLVCVAKPPLGGWRKRLVAYVGDDYILNVKSATVASPVSKEQAEYRMDVVDRPGSPLGAVAKLRPGAMGDPGAKELMEAVAQLDGLEELYLSGPEVTDNLLRHLSGLTDLRALHLTRTNVTGAGLVHIRSLKRLERIEMPDTVVSDADLASLAGLTKLQALRFDASRLTDDGAVHLRRLTRLNHLQLTRSSMTSKGLQNLAGMTQLTHLVLDDTRVADLAPIAGLTWLRALRLNRTPIDDAGLAPVSGFRLLTHLDLDGTNVTDDGLAAVAGLPALQRLSIAKTAATNAALHSLAGLAAIREISAPYSQITSSGRRSFLKARPGVRINL